MLRSLRGLEHYSVVATDGDVGRVADFLLDDERWVVRYLVAETGRMFDERRVLITPVSFREADWSTKQFHVALTLDTIKRCPRIDIDGPVSREHEAAYFRFLGYPFYWGYSGPWGMGAFPGLLASEAATDPSVESAEAVSGEMHLRSTNELHGYHLQGTDDGIGKVDDVIVDDETWEVRYLVIDTSHWWSGNRVLIAPHWVSRIRWQDREVDVAMTQQAVKDSPEWDAGMAISRDYEGRLHDYYGRPAYWNTEEPAPTPQTEASTHGAGA